MATAKAAVTSTSHGPQTSASFSAWVESMVGREATSGVTIYGDPDSRTSRSLWMARELEAAGALQINHVMIGRANPFSAETDKINPNRRMPFLDDNGIAVFESMAINLHLARRYGEGTGLAPQGWEEEAACLKWSFWSMTELDIKLWELCVSGPARVDPNHPWHTHPVVRNPLTPNRRGQTGTFT
jgi:hypothetical protein